MPTKTMKGDRRTVTTIPGLTLADLVRAESVEALDPAEGWKTAIEVAAELRVSSRAATMRLDKLVAAGKVEKRRGRLLGRSGFPPWFYRPTPPR